MYISSDTNIWIDFYELGHIDHPFRLDYQFCISKDTFSDEFLNSEDLRLQLMRNGLQLVDVTDEEFDEALLFQEKYPALSLYDTFALAIAKRRSWVLLSGDLPLRKAAEKENVEIHGTIWIYDQLKNEGKITSEEYLRVMDELIQLVKTGKRRLPMAELLRRRS